jgi:hypothetical protein
VTEGGKDHRADDRPNSEFDSRDGGHPNAKSRYAPMTDWPFVPDRSCRHCDAPLSDGEARRGDECDLCREVGEAMRNCKHYGTEFCFRCGERLP